MRSKYSLSLSLSLSLGLTSLTVISGAILSAPFSFADDSVVDDINITVPIACTMSGTGMTSHTATVNPGNYTPNIGTTTLKAYCNDSSGFAIYAAGYTGNTIGETNSNKLVGTTHTTETIPTGIATSGTSQWAMKLTTDSNATYPITIDSAPNTSGGSDATFSAYHVVPNEYTKVAHRNSSTDVGTNAIGAELTTTYAVNISSTQIADTYVGQVIYTMVHPSYNLPITDDQIRVIYDGNGSFFDQAQTKSKNIVIYQETSARTGEYIATTPTIVKTSNLANDGTKNSAYDETETIKRTLSFAGASKVRVNLTYGVTGDYYTNFAPGEYSYEDEDWPSPHDERIWAGGWGYGHCYDADNCTSDPNDDGYDSGTMLLEFEDTDTVSIMIYCDNTSEYCAPEEDYDYGFYYEIYPIYDTEQAGTTEITTNSFTPVSGTYASAPGGRVWVLESGGTSQVFTSEAQIIQYLNDNSTALKGETLTVKATDVQVTVVFSSCLIWNSADCYGTFSNGGTENTVIYGYDNSGSIGALSGTYEQFWDSSNNCYRSSEWYLSFNETGYEFCSESDVKAFLQSNLSSLNGTTIRIYLEPHFS